MSDNHTVHFTKIDLRWLVVTYCFLVLFHLLLSLLVSGLKEFFLTSGILRFILWSGGGIVLVSGYVGRRSSGITILEPGIASMLYMATLIPAVSNIRGINASGYRLVGLLVALLLIAFLVGCFGAAAGEWMQARRIRKEKTSENS